MATEIKTLGKLPRSAFGTLGALFSKKYKVD
jgi:hypothetical protein